VTYPVDAPDKPGNEIIFYRRLPDGDRSRENRADESDAAG
jgi:hypothetical protein